MRRTAPRIVIKNARPHGEVNICSDPASLADISPGQRARQVRYRLDADLDAAVSPSVFWRLAAVPAGDGLESAAIAMPSRRWHLRRYRISETMFPLRVTLVFWIAPEATLLLYAYSPRSSLLCHIILLFDPARRPTFAITPQAASAAATYPRFQPELCRSQVRLT